MSYLFCQVLTKKLKILFWQIRDVSFCCNCISQYNLMLLKYAAWFTHKRGFYETNIVYAVCTMSEHIIKL